MHLLFTKEADIGHLYTNLSDRTEMIVPYRVPFHALV